MKKVSFEQLFEFLPKSKRQAGTGLSDGLYPFYTSSNILTKYIDEFDYTGDCLIFGTGGNPSVHFQSGNFSSSTDCIVACPKNSKQLNAKYSYLFFRSNMNILESGFKGAGLKHISKEYISNIKIPLPPLDDQIRIADVLTRAQKLIAKRKESIEALDEFLKSTFLEMFGDPVRNERGWDSKPMSVVAKLERGRFSPRPRNDPSYFEGKYPFIQTGDISGSNHRLNNFTQTLNEKGIKVSKMFMKGNIVIAIVGATIGATAILEIDVYATDSIICIKPIKSIVNPIYLEYNLRFWREPLLKNAPEAARPNINLAILNNVGIILPSLTLQNKFGAIVEKVEAMKVKYNESLVEMEKLYGSLSQRAFRGEL